MGKLSWDTFCTTINIRREREGGEKGRERYMYILPWYSAFADRERFGTRYTPTPIPTHKGSRFGGSLQGRLLRHTHSSRFFCTIPQLHNLRKRPVIWSTSVTLVCPLSSHNLSDCPSGGQFQRSSLINAVISVHPVLVAFCP